MCVRSARVSCMCKLQLRPITRSAWGLLPVAGTTPRAGMQVTGVQGCWLVQVRQKLATPP